MPWLSNRSSNESLETIRKKLDDFRNYRRHEKPPRAEEKGNLETLFNTLQTKLRLSNRPAFLPREGHLIKVSHKIFSMSLLKLTIRNCKVFRISMLLGVVWKILRKASKNGF